MLVLAPTSKDAELTRSVLDTAGVASFGCRDLKEICAQLEAGAAAILLPEDSILPDCNHCLVDWLDRAAAVVRLARFDPRPAGRRFRRGRPGHEPSGECGGARATDPGGGARQCRPHGLASAAAAVPDSRSSCRTRSRHAGPGAPGRHRRILRRRHRQQNLGGKNPYLERGCRAPVRISADEAIGQPITLLIPAERHDEESALFGRIRRGERVEHFETVRVAKDGRHFDVSLTVSPVRDANGDIIGASKVARDITQHKEAEAALREADRRKNEFLAILAHELRNPLAPIRNSLHILRMSAGSDPSLDCVSEIMERQVNHMVRLVDDLLEISRVTRGKIELRKELGRAGCHRARSGGNKPPAH